MLPLLPFPALQYALQNMEPEKRDDHHSVMKNNW